MKRNKTLQCKDCNKKYTHFNRWVEKHVAKTGHRQYKRINDEDFKYQYGK